MRLFRSPWTYLIWLTLTLDQIRHKLHPHPHPALPPWHPMFNAGVLTFAYAFCIALMFSFSRLNTNALERSGLGLLALTFVMSATAQLFTLIHFHTPLPSFRLVYLVLNALIALLLAIRFLQVLREPSAPGILSQMLAPTE